MPCRAWRSILGASGKRSCLARAKADGWMAHNSASTSSDCGKPKLVSRHSGNLTRVALGFGRCGAREGSPDVRPSNGLLSLLSSDTALSSRLIHVPVVTSCLRVCERRSDEEMTLDDVTKTLRCYAYGHGSNCQAICIDFDIAVHGSSQQQVRDRLTASLNLFLRDLLDLPLRGQRHLSQRKSQWHTRTKLACMAWLRWGPLGAAWPMALPFSIHRTTLA